jgi:hypothetical protein
MLGASVYRYLCTVWSILATVEHVPDNEVLIRNWNCYLSLWQQAPCKDCTRSQATLVICVMILSCVKLNYQRQDCRHFLKEELGGCCLT